MAQSSVCDLPDGVEITGAIATGYGDILTPDRCRLSRNCIARLNRGAANVIERLKKTLDEVRAANAEFFRLIREWTAEPYDKILDRNRR